MLGLFNIIFQLTHLRKFTISASFAMVALNNLHTIVSRRLWLIAFAFGLVHGFVFASVLRDLGFSKNARILSLFGFTLGVEIGQLAIVMLVLPRKYGLRK
ncbi:MAG: hypothetical protein NPINA01_27670 [Nitrospinaceae bacterium]|nr:MAG: hypothetical protein NPINA01_27670 [Nitrospinaceae bacterium]